MSLNITGLQSASSPYAIAAATVSPYDTLSTTTQDPFSDPNGPFANLDLTTQQQSQIQQLLSSNSQSGSQSPTQLFQQVENILTPQQQATLKTDLETKSAHHHHHHHSSASTTDTSNSSSPAYDATGSVPAESAAASSFQTNA